MVRRDEGDDDDDDDDDDAEAEAVAHTSTYSSAGKKSASTVLGSELELLDSEDTVLWYLPKLPHATVYVCHARMVRNDDDDESDA